VLVGFPDGADLRWRRADADSQAMTSRSWSRRLLGAITALAAVAAAATILALPFVVDHDRTRPRDPLAYDPEVLAPDDPGPNPAAVRRRLVPPKTGVYLGASSFSLVSQPGAIRRWASAHGPRPRIVNWFQQWLSGERHFRDDWARRVSRAGAIPMVTWEPWYAPAGELHVAEQPNISLDRIAEGDFDRYIRTWARSIAAYRGPVLIRLMHEMNGFWYPWGVSVNGNTPADYVAAWRHVHRIFDKAGARNVSWVWSINNLEGPDGESHDLTPYYPGDRYVDWVSTSGFNWGQAYDWSSWRDADALYGATYRALAKFGKPVMISEIGTTAVGGDPKAWIRETLHRLRTGYPKLRAILWYDDVDAAGLDFRLRGATENALRQPSALGDDWVRKPVLEALPR
jgi:hypothetical protein